MLLTTEAIADRYQEGIESITNISFNKLLRDRYAVQYADKKTDLKTAMLLFALDSWDNTVGAVNWLTQTQLMAILDNINSAHLDSLTDQATLSAPIGNGCGCSGSTGGSAIEGLKILNTNSISLSFVNGVLSATLQVSNDAGNQLDINSDGSFVPKLNITSPDSSVTVDDSAYPDVTLEAVGGGGGDIGTGSF